MMFAHGSGRSVSGGKIQEEVNAYLAEIMKDNGAEPRDKPDDDEIKCPFARGRNLDGTMLA